MAIPYGVMAERYGHRAVLCLSALGRFIEAVLTLGFCWWPQNFDFHIVCVLPLFTFIGGGSSVQSATFFACLSELSTNASRATVFAYFGGVDLGARLVLSILAASMIDRNAWLPIYIGLGCSAASVIWSICLPRASFGSPSGEPSRSTDGAPREDFNELHHPSNTLLGKVREGVRKTLNSLTFLSQRANWSVLTLMIPLLLTSIAWRSLQLLAQLARKRFGWSWSDASYLVPLETSVCIAVLILLLPAASFVISDRLSMPAVSRDLILARASFLLAALGAVVVGLSKSPATMIAGLCVYYLGTGYNVILRSLLASVVEGHTPILFNCVALLEAAGSLISGPVMAQSFRAGLRFGGSWVGIPFFIAAGLSTAAFLTLSAAKSLAWKDY
ncbi:hypothetical protein HIM_10345 [Hirsutella minnesotensis 3608]|uniref:Major facilitator superfamily (MFS) profile domain-containing protein n=1 Tax=Hirsutella minnesotensis 3608 TaxID=1043627 RepID=A0A0F8A2E4_9HYPO|nr:hypothetical protein HIM_10345 [Hirsutella minnesotensis 3608]